MQPSGQQHRVHVRHSAFLNDEWQEEPGVVVLHVLPPIGVEFFHARPRGPIVIRVKRDQAATFLSRVTHVAGPGCANLKLSHQRRGIASRAYDPIDPTCPRGLGATVADEEVDVAAGVSHNVQIFVERNAVGSVRALFLMSSCLQALRST